MSLTKNQLKELLSAALEGRELGYRPYSNYAVGAAVLTVDGRIYGGCGNVENCNFSLTIHAEQTATIAAITDGAISRCGPKFIRAVYLPMISGERVIPCGGCRQFLWEFSDQDTQVICQTPGGDQFFLLSELLPEMFNAQNLEGSGHPTAG
jgi:cytidine deaminase